VEKMTAVTSLLIAMGAILMLFSIFKYQRIKRQAKELITDTNRHIIWMNRFHQVAILFFFLGYIFVLLALLADIQIIGEFIIGLIFFFGAIFVLFGIFVQSNMLSSIQQQTEAILKNNEQLAQTKQVTIYALAYQAEIRDQETGKHLDRTSEYVRILAEELAVLPEYQGYLSLDYINDLVNSAPLHDIGKVGIPDSVLLKPGKLTNDEFEIIKKHCELGADVLTKAEEKLDFQSFLRIAVQLVNSHHEKWNGQGYPKGLKDNMIPISARIMSLADVYDALRSERCYKKAFSHEKACEIIKEDKGTHFDPVVVDCFLNVEKKFHHVSEILADTVTN
jgi:response regulator RpfG family c-di-GMP phosphodiesterase